MTMNEDNNRPRRVGMRDEGFGWGIPAAVLAAILIIGGLFYMNSGDRTTTASNDRPATTSTTTSGPAGSQAPAKTPTTVPAPAPAPTPKQ
jgi:hypothetical protein